MKFRRLMALGAAAALLVAACGGDDDDAAPETEAPSEETEAPPAETEAPSRRRRLREATEAPSEATEAPSEDTEAPSAGADVAAQRNADGESICGLGNGEEATGEPIKAGAVMTSIPGIDFTDISNLAAAYFDCVNANGGIYGHPVELIVENDELDPQKASAAAAKLIESDGVVAMVSSTSILDCPVNGPYYEEQGFYAIIAGVPAECFGLPNMAAVNMGPHYSALGAAQAVVRAGATGKMVAVTGIAPGSEYNSTGVEALAAEEGLDYEAVFLELPITDADTAILDIVSKAGEGGGVTLTFTPPEMIKLMVAAENQGVIDDVIWGSATPANDSSVAAAVGPDWDGKLLINAEFQPTDFDGPDTRLYNQVSADYAPDSPLSSFGQMGFLTGRIFVTALLSMGEGADYTPEAVNAAIVGTHEGRVRHLVQAVVLRRPAVAHPQQLGHHGGARFGPRQDGAVRGLLRDRCSRRTADPDAGRRGGTRARGLRRLTTSTSSFDRQMTTTATNR